MGEEYQAELLVFGDVAQPGPAGVAHVLGAEYTQLRDAGSRRGRPVPE